MLFNLCLPQAHTVWYWQFKGNRMFFKTFSLQSESVKQARLVFMLAK
jgi:hypothetical protein